MKLEPFPFESFKSTVRCDLTGAGARCYRFVHADPDKKIMAFFDLDDKGFSLGKQLLVKTYEELQRLPDEAVAIVPDPFPPITIELTDDAKTQAAIRQKKKKAPKREGDWVTRWKKIKGLVSREHIDWSLLGDHGFGDLYVDPLWRHELIDLLIADSETKRYEVERVLGIYLRFGGTYDALRPRTQACGKRGFPKWQLAEAMKSGRPYKDPILRGRANCPRTNRADAFWIKRLREAIDGIVKEYDAEAAKRVRDRGFFLNYFYVNCCYLTELEDGTRIPVDEATIPSPRALIYHRDLLLLEYPTLKPLVGALNGARGGSGKALTFGVLDTADLDGTLLPEACLVVADDDRHDVTPENCRYCGPATIMLGICRKSNAYAGWLVTAGEESREHYQYLMYNILTPHDERLRQLGLDPADYPGIVNGQFDQIVMDRGPGASHKMLDWTVDGIKIDVRLTRAGAPQDKGGIEGGIGRVKQAMRSDGTLRAAGPMGELLRAKILERLKALPPGVATVKSIQQAAQRKQRKRDSKEILLITPKALEIVVIEVINKLNLKRSRKPTVLDERMFLAHVEPIPARLLAEHQMLRRGNAALVRRPVDLLASIIEPRYCTVEGGKITVGKLSYGSPSSVPEGDEGARALLQYGGSLAARGIDAKTAKIEVYVKPYKNVVWWRRGEGDWLRLAPTVESAEHCNPNRDWIEIQAFESGWNRDEEAARLKALKELISQKPKPAKKLPAEMVDELEKIRDAQLAAWHGPAPVDRDARKALQQDEKQRRHEAASAAAGVPDTSPLLTVPAEQNTWRTKGRSLKDYLADDD